VTTVNAIFSKAGSPQTVDITGITQNSCYESNGLSGNKINVSAVNCATTAINPLHAILKMLVFPQPATQSFVVELPNIAMPDDFELYILDLNGKVLRRENFKGKSVIIERENLPQGLVILRILSPETGLQFNSKLSLR